MFSWFRPKIENLQNIARTIAYARVSEGKREIRENDRIYQKVITLQSKIASFVTKEFGLFFSDTTGVSSVIHGTGWYNARHGTTK